MKTTIEQLANEIKGKLWVKGDLKRIYLDRGFNTKKMLTRTFIYEVGGVFKVSCYIECPSQPYQWVSSQKDKVVDSVESEIVDAIDRIENPEKYVKFDYLPYSKRVKSIINPSPIKQEISESIVTPKGEVKTLIPFEGGLKYNHKIFGIGSVTNEDENTITIVFESVGEKKLLKKFASLTPIA